MADGGGLAPALTADLAARAIIAAATVFGEDPLQAAAGDTQASRAVRMAAAGGLNVAGVCSVRRAAKALRVHEVSVSKARSKGRADFDRAEASAADAVAQALKVEPAPKPVAPPKRTPPPGPIAAQSRPPVSKPPVAVEDTPCRDLVLIALEAAGALDSANVASAIDRKELLVIGALRQLEHEGVVVCEPNPGGTRPLRWKVAVHG